MSELKKKEVERLRMRRLLTYKEAADIVGASVGSIGEAVRRGVLRVENLPGTTGNRARRIVAASLWKWLVERGL